MILRFPDLGALIERYNQLSVLRHDSPGLWWGENMNDPVGRSVRTIIFVLVLIAISCSRANANNVVCDFNGCINLNTFLANIVSKLAGVDGYVVIVGTLPPASGGYAHTATDPPLTAMSADIPMNIASVSKTLTTVAILQLLAQNGLTIDTPIWDYIYSWWTKNQSVGQITFKELLTHTSGFGQVTGCGDDITYGALQALVAQGVDPSNIGQALYGNCNFALLRELMPALLGQSGTLESCRLSPSCNVAQTSSDLYINYMNQHVFAPLGIPTSSCKAAEPNAIKSYPVPPGSTPGDDFGDWTLMCGSSGWSLTATDLLKVINDLATGSLLLTNDEKSLMNSNCLGWDCAVGANCPEPYVCKNGDQFNGDGISFWTYAGIFKSTVPVVVYVNSFIPFPYQPYSVNGTPYNSACRSQGVPNACCSGQQTGTCMTCPAGQTCGTNIIGLVADAYADVCGSLGEQCCAGSLILQHRTDVQRQPDL